MWLRGCREEGGGRRMTTSQKHGNDEDDNGTSDDDNGDIDANDVIFGKRPPIIFVLDHNKAIMQNINREIS